MNLVISQPPASVKQVMRRVIHKVVCPCSIDEPGKGDLLCGIEAHSQGCFDGLETPGSGIKEVLVGVVTIDEELT